MSVCRNGHTFDRAVSLACPVCAKESSAAMLIEFLERAVRNRERTYRTLDHITVNADYWKRSLQKQDVGTTEIEVPMLCGAVRPLAEVVRAVQRIVKHSAEEQEYGKCRGCEARLAGLSAEAGARP